MWQCWDASPMKRPTFEQIKEFLYQCPIVVMKASQDFKENDNEMIVEKGDTVAVIDGSPENYWWRGQNLRSFVIGKFPRYVGPNRVEMHSETILQMVFRRCALDPMRPKQPEDVSKPLASTFQHTGHGDTFGKSWGNPTTIENLTFRKSAAAGDGFRLSRSPALESRKNSSKCASIFGRIDDSFDRE